MRTTFIVILVLADVLMLAGIFVFHYGMEPQLSWLDSLYFVVTIMTTIGFGDISLKDAPTGVKVFGIFLMMASPALMAGIFGIITDYLLKARLEQLIGPRRYRMRNHIVLCGLGHVGMRILEQLRKLDVEIIVVEKVEDSRFVEEAKRMKVPVVSGDVRLPSILEKVNIKEARSLIIATDDDLTNLEVALNAREVRPDIRLVLRMFDHTLANKIRTGFGIKTTFSTSALAAPAFAMAAVDPAVVGSFYVGEDLILVLQFEVASSSKLKGLTIEEARKLGSLSVLSHEARGGKDRRLHPPESLRISEGDRIVVSATPENWIKIKALNTPA